MYPACVSWVSAWGVWGQHVSRTCQRGDQGKSEVVTWGKVEALQRGEAGMEMGTWGRAGYCTHGRRRQFSRHTKWGLNPLLMLGS